MTSRSVGFGGNRRTVTVTFGYEDGLHTLVAKNLRLALVIAEGRWGRWQTVESISSPDTIYADITGLTKALHETNAGTHGSQQTPAAKLRAIGYEPAPGEVAGVGYYREELPRLHMRRTTQTRRGARP